MSLLIRQISRDNGVARFYWSSSSMRRSSSRPRLSSLASPRSSHIPRAPASFSATAATRGATAAASRSRTTVAADEGQRIRQSQREIQKPTAQLAKTLRQSTDARLAEFGNQLAQGILDLDSIDDDENWDDDLAKIAIIADKVKALAAHCKAGGASPDAPPPSAVSTPSNPTPSTPPRAEKAPENQAPPAYSKECTSEFWKGYNALLAGWTSAQIRGDEARRNGEITQAEGAEISATARKIWDVTMKLSQQIQETNDPAFVRAGADLARALAALDKVNDDSNWEDDIAAVRTIVGTVKLFYALCPNLYSMKELYPDGPWPNSTPRTQSILDVVANADQRAVGAVMLVDPDASPVLAFGVVPYRAAIAPGTHTLAVMRAGYMLYKDSFTAEAGQVRKMVVNLPPEPPARPKRKGASEELSASWTKQATFSIDADERKVFPIKVPPSTVGIIYRLSVGSDQSDVAGNLLSLVGTVGDASSTPEGLVASAAAKFMNSMSDYQATFYVFTNAEEARKWRDVGTGYICPETGMQTRSVVSRLSNDCFGESRAQPSGIRRATN